MGGAASSDTASEGGRRGRLPYSGGVRKGVVRGVAPQEEEER